MTPKEVLTKWVERINLHHPQMMGELYHDDAVNLQVAIGTPLVGRIAIENDFAEFFNVIPDTYTKIENLFGEGDWAILEWSGGGTFKPSGKTFTLRGCGFFQVTDGKIKFQRGYWDKHTWFSQIGLPLEGKRD